MQNMNNKVVIIDAHFGNLRSIEYKLLKVGIDVKTTSSNQEINNADKIILAGVGHFKKAMENLKELNLITTLEKKVMVDKVPVFGICLGMQLFSDFSEEGGCKGLGWIKGEIRKFNFPEKEKLRIPNVGWHRIILKKNHELLDDIGKDQYFYFTHSYYWDYSSEYTIAETEYGLKFTSVISKDNIFGTQFHPEKSHRNGFKLLVDFCRL